MKTRRPLLIGVIAVLAMTSLGCGLLSGAVNSAVNKAVGGNQTFTKTDALWSDVPQMDGLTPSTQDTMPTFIKLGLDLILGNLGRLNPAGTDQTTGNIDWLVFTTDKTTDDIANYYTNAKMVESGWDDAGQDSTCLKGTDAGVAQVGVFCVFQKQADNTQLAIIAAQDTQTNQTNVFFLRLQENTTPTPTP
jgi:hypothetical protein